MQTILTAGYVLSALLPIFGILGLFKSSRKEVEELKETGATLGSGGSLAMLTNMVANAGPKIIDQHRKIIQDLILIGGGLAIGAATSIAVLYI